MTEIISLIDADVKKTFQSKITAKTGIVGHATTFWITTTQTITLGRIIS